MNDTLAVDIHAAITLGLTKYGVMIKRGDANAADRVADSIDTLVHALAKVVEADNVKEVTINLHLPTEEK